MYDVCCYICTKIYLHIYIYIVYICATPRHDYVEADNFKPYDKQ